jgi:hypothetical protein
MFSRPFVALACLYVTARCLLDWHACVPELLCLLPYRVTLQYTPICFTGRLPCVERVDFPREVFLGNHNFICIIIIQL